MGQMPFPNPGDVYFSMINVFMETQMHDIEFVLNAGYKTLIYDGNFDIICNLNKDSTSARNNINISRGRLVLIATINISINNNKNIHICRK